MKNFNLQKVTKVLLILAGALTIAAILLYVIKPARRIIIDTPVEKHVQVSAGDTLSKILSEYGVSGGDINTIATLLKKDCGVQSLRANSDVLVIKKKRIIF